MLKSLLGESLPFLRGFFLTLKAVDLGNVHHRSAVFHPTKAVDTEALPVGTFDQFIVAFGVARKHTTDPSPLLKLGPFLRALTRLFVPSTHRYLLEILQCSAEFVYAAARGVDTLLRREKTIVGTVQVNEIAEFFEAFQSFLVTRGGGRIRDTSFVFADKPRKAWFRSRSTRLSSL